MKNRSTVFFYYVLAGLLLTTQIATAQQPSTDSRDNSAKLTCRTPVTVRGAVRAPSRIELRRRVRLLEILAASGGMTERAGKTVEIKRAALGSHCPSSTPNEPDKQAGAVEIYILEEIKRGDDRANPYVLPGDSVTVPEVGVAYITGNVAHPRPIPLDRPITLTQAIEMAGGLLTDSLTNRVRIFRGSCSELKVLAFDLKAIKKRRAEDVVIQPYDIIEVPGKGQHGGRPVCQPSPPPPPELPLRRIY